MILNGDYHTSTSLTSISWIQVCKQLIATQKSHLASSTQQTKEQSAIIFQNAQNKTDIEAASSNEQIAHNARTLLSAVRQACSSGSALDPRRLLMCAELVAAEELPQAARWHRRDLAPGLIAAWRAVLRAIAPPPGAAAVLAAARSVRKET
jgi:hypothetical protein